MIPSQAIEENLSVSYVTAVVSCAGATYDIIKHDYGVDVTILFVE
ncbi:hypothetical protein LDFHOB_07370 [Candidatus Electronema aureum]